MLTFCMFYILYHSQGLIIIISTFKSFFMVLTNTITSIAYLFTVCVCIYFSIIRNRSPFTGRTPIAWWIIGLGISQVFILSLFAAWHERWWSAHQTLITVSVTFAIICAIAWLIIWIAQRRWNNGEIWHANKNLLFF